MDAVFTRAATIFGREAELNSYIVIEKLNDRLESQGFPAINRETLAQYSQPTSKLKHQWRSLTSGAYRMARPVLSRLERRAEQAYTRPIETILTIANAANLLKEAAAAREARRQAARSMAPAASSDDYQGDFHRAFGDSGFSSDGPARVFGRQNTPIGFPGTDSQDTQADCRDSTGEPVANGVCEVNTPDSGFKVSGPSFSVSGPGFSSSL